MQSEVPLYTAYFIYTIPKEDVSNQLSASQYTKSKDNPIWVTAKKYCGYVFLFYPFTNPNFLYIHLAFIIYI